MSKTEILLPVGNMSMCLAAIHNGADAIYMGVRKFNARGRSEQLDLESAKEIIDLCHLYGVKVNLAFNVVVFEDELEDALQTLLDYLPLAPDAFIIQDLGLAKLLRTLAPEQAIHASTQMTVTNHEAIELLRDLGIKRFVLGRENSLDEIKKIRENTDAELEVFVHGALCVAYSGQCFTSESIGGRSANRGQCAQSCRLPYELYVDGEKKEMGEKQYLVSPQDLCGIEEAQTLAEIGVNCLKVEGRLKTPEYVAAAAKSYSQKLSGLQVNQDDLALTYSRGFFSGWLHGVDHQKLVPADYQAHRGILIGEIVQVKKDRLVIHTQRQLLAGVGLFFLKDQKQLGATVFQVLSAHQDLCELTLHKANYSDYQIGMKAYLNSDPKTDERLKKSFTQPEMLKRIPLSLEVHAQLERPLKVVVSDGENQLTFLSEELVEAPLKNETTLENIQAELSSLGRTCFILQDLTLNATSPFFFSQKNLKKLRQSFVSKLMEKRLERSIKKTYLEKAQSLIQRDVLICSSEQKTKLTLLLRNKEQVQALEGLDVEKIESVTLDFEFGKDYQSTLELLRSLGIKSGIATTRIHKPQEYYNLNTLLRLRPDFILVRNLGALSYLKNKGIELRGDFSLNMTNHLSYQYLMSHGLTSVTPSFDLNVQQLTDLVKSTKPQDLEVVIHQYMPEFHMEHCVFAAFLSEGSSFRDCGKPCEKHHVELKDPYGQFHYLKADHECRNTFYKGSPQSAGFLLEELQRSGVSKLRIEALSESAAELKQKVELYLLLLNNSLSYLELKKKINVQEKYGLTNY